MVSDIILNSDIIMILQNLKIYLNNIYIPECSHIKEGGATV